MNVWVSNSSSRGHRELDEAPAVRNPPHMAEIASLGPFGPGVFGPALDENRRRYVRRTNA
jgi:hypothetical protein